MKAKLVYESLEDIFKPKSEENIEKDIKNNPKYKNLINFYEKIKQLEYDISLTSFLTLKNKLSFPVSYSGHNLISNTLDIFSNWTKNVKTEYFNLRVQLILDFKNKEIKGIGEVTINKVFDWNYIYKNTYDLIGTSEKEIISSLNDAYDDVVSNIEYNDDVFRDGLDEIYIRNGDDFY